MLTHTQVNVTLSVNVIARKNGFEQLFAFNLVQITFLLFWIISTIQILNVIRADFLLLAQDIKSDYELYSKILAIAFSAISYGVLK